MITFFKTTWHEPRITVVEAERQSFRSIWVNGRRFAKRSYYTNFWTSWVEAHAFLFKHAETQHYLAGKTYEKAKKNLDKVRELKPCKM